MFMISFYIVYIEQNHQRFMVNQRNSPCFFRTPIGLWHRTAWNGENRGGVTYSARSSGGFYSDKPRRENDMRYWGKIMTMKFPICEPWCWYIYLQNWVIFRANVGANVGKYSIHGAYGFGVYRKNPIFIESHPLDPGCHRICRKDDVGRILNEP